MKCVQCNTPIADNARFCPQCGSPVATKPSEALHPHNQIQEQPVSPAIEAASPVEQAEQSELEADSTAEPPDSTSQSEDDVPIDPLPAPYEPPTALAESIDILDVVDEGAKEQGETSSVSTEETVEIGPLMRAVAEAKVESDDTKDALVEADGTPQVVSSPSVELATPTITVTRSETARVPGRPRSGQGAKSSVNIPSRPEPIPTPPTPVSMRHNQAISPSTGVPARPRQTTGRFQQSTQSMQPAAPPPSPSQMPVSPIPAEQTLTSLPTMPMATMPPTPQTPSVQPASPIPETPALPEMPIAPTQYFQAQPFSSRTRPGVITMQQTKRSRNRRGCLPGFLITLVLVVILGAVGWVYVARPYLHDQAVAQIDQAMTAEVNQLPTILPLSGGTLRVTDAMLDNLLALSLPSNIPIQHPQVQISTNGLQIDFQTENLSSTITGVPVASQGHLLLSQVAVNGVISLILSAHDIASLFNQHIAAALARIHHTVRSVTLLNHEMDLVLA